MPAVSKRKPTKPTKPTKPARPTRPTKPTKAKSTKPTPPTATPTKPTPAAGPWSADAYGLSRVRPGFGKTPADDVLFALGFPHLVVPTDDAEPKGWREPSKIWKLFPRVEATHVPRTALPYVYAYHVRPTEAAAILGGPVPTFDLAAEAAKLFWRDRRMVFFLEALFGSEAVATAAVDVLGKFPTKAWRADELDRSGWNGIHDLGFVLLRVSPATRTKLLARLEKVFATVSKAQGTEWWRPLQALDIVLHGRTGYERSEGGWSDLSLVLDDPAWAGQQALAMLKRMKPADRARCDSQLAFLGGAKVTAAMRQVQFFSEYRADAKRQLARLA